MRVHIRQPPFSHCCGQACVAMLAGVSLDEVIRVVGHDHGSRWIELRDALFGFGLDADDGLSRGYCPQQFPELCVVKLHWPNRRGAHWMIRDGVWVLDPDLSRPIYWAEVQESVSAPVGEWSVTSYAEVRL